MGGSLNVLVISHDRDHLRKIDAQLSQPHPETYSIQSATTLQEALDRLAQGGSDVILLDLDLPDSEGLDTYERLHTRVSDIPIIVCTAHSDDSVALETVRKGAQDHLVKPSSDPDLLARILRYAVERHRRHAALQNVSLIDDLTGLYNRRAFFRFGEQQVKLALRSQRGLLLMLTDLDGFKQINDTYGHHSGDQALIEAADILKGTFRSSDIVARLGGDEFAIIAIDAQTGSDPSLVGHLLERLKDANARYRPKYFLSFSVGIAYLNPKQPMTLEQLLSRADQALYEEKRKKKTPR